MIRRAPPERRATAARRLRCVLYAGGALWALAAGRLAQVQGVDRPLYARLARSQQERPQPIPARRGAILDRHGRQLALDVAAVSFYARPAAVREPGAVARHFAGIRGRAAADVRRQLGAGRPFVYLLRQAHDEELARARARRFAGVFEEAQVRRYYPYGRLAGQLLGFTDIDHQGREGAELAYDTYLAAHPGERLSYVDSRGRLLPVPSADTTPARPGADVQLTIDVTMQGILEEELAQAVDSSRAESGLAIVTDPRTGDILALVAAPGFDPNDPGAAPADHRRNRLVTDPFEPGSTFKPITMAAVLDAGMPADTVVFCEEGAIELATGDTLRDTKAHGWLSAGQVLAYSSNIGTTKLARRLQRPELYAALRRFGFGTRTGLGLPAESAGLLRHARDWSERSLETIAIGQEVSVTALQLVQAFGAIANGGVLMAPRLLTAVRDQDGRVLERFPPQAVRRVVTPRTAGLLQGMLRGVVEHGTGRRAAIDGIAVAGKTGTAQRALPGGGGYAPDEYVASFVGFLPAAPGYLCLVVIENPRVGKYGGSVAAPAFRRTMERILALEGRVAPPAAATASRPASTPPIPDLRGLSPRSARAQASRRGLLVQFEGEGDLVLAQVPSPLTVAASDVVVCQLGAADAGPVPILRGAPLRQAVLMRKLGMPGPLVALAP